MLWFLLSLAAFMVLAIGWTLQQSSRAPRPVSVSAAGGPSGRSRNFGYIGTGLGGLCLGVAGVGLWIADNQHFSPRARYCSLYESYTGHTTTACGVDEFFDSLKIVFSVGGVLLLLCGVALLVAGLRGGRAGTS